MATDNRRIQSMHNLTINKSRSNSADTLDNLTSTQNDDSAFISNKKTKERKSNNFKQFFSYSISHSFFNN